MQLREQVEPIIKFTPFQKAWLADQSRFKIGMFARQTGKTFTTCAEIVDDCIKAEIEGRRVHWVILSRGERQAKLAIQDGIQPFVKAFYILYRAALKNRAEPTIADIEFPSSDQEPDYKGLEVTFPGGSRITALPANPDTARGYSANVFLDEFAIHPNSREIWAALFPIVSKNGLKLRVTSTPKGKGTKFHELITANDNVWSRHIVDIHEAVAQGLDRDIEELRAALGDDDIWRQEFELEFLDEAEAWLSYDLINSVEEDRAGVPANYNGGPVFIGNDIAARNDLWVAWVLEEVGDVLWTREIVARKRISFFEQDAIMDELFQRYRVTRLVMDQTGMGEKPVQDAQRRYGELRVEGVLFTAASKLRMATIGKQLMEDRRVRIPVGDVELRADLHKIKKIEGGTGHPRLVADQDAEGHADRAWAYFMACAGADQPLPPPAGAEIAADPTTNQSERARLNREGHGSLGLRRPRPLKFRRAS